MHVLERSGWPISLSHAHMTANSQASHTYVTWTRASARLLQHIQHMADEVSTVKAEAHFQHAEHRLQDFAQLLSERQAKRKAAWTAVSAALTDVQREVDALVAHETSGLSGIGGSCTSVDDKLVGEDEPSVHKSDEDSFSSGTASSTVPSTTSRENRRHKADAPPECGSMRILARCEVELGDVGDGTGTSDCDRNSAVPEETVKGLQSRDWRRGSWAHSGDIAGFLCEDWLSTPGMDGNRADTRSTVSEQAWALAQDMATCDRILQGLEKRAASLPCSSPRISFCEALHCGLMRSISEGYSRQRADELCDDCCKLSCQIEYVAADALELGCKRSVPGAMDVFAQATEALERIVVVMQRCQPSARHAAPKSNVR